MPCHRTKNYNTCALTVCLALAVAAGSDPAWAQDTKATQEKAKQEQPKPAKKKEMKAKKTMPKDASEADRADPCLIDHELPGCAKATNKNK